MNNIDSHFIETHNHWGAETARYRLEINFNTIPFIRQLRYYLARKKQTVISYLKKPLEADYLIDTTC